jgi:predicted transcriptional regulator
MKLGLVESRFAELVWEHAPLGSGELVRLCEKELNWKKATTYTVLRKFCDRGMFRNEKGVVTVMVGREAFYAARSEEFVEETFGGSLPSFIAAFTQRKKLTPEEVSEIRKLIEGF